MKLWFKWRFSGTPLSFKTWRGAREKLQAMYDYFNPSPPL